MRKLLNPWGPWSDNPSKPENFYGKIIEEIKPEDVIEKNKDEEKVEEGCNESQEKESQDPYADILKDLK